MNIDAINESEVLFPAKFRESIDWDTVNRLADDSQDFRGFISDLTEDIKISKIKSDYDKVLEDENVIEYIKEKKII